MSGHKGEHFQQCELCNKSISNVRTIYFVVRSDVQMHIQILHPPLPPQQ